jgi:hypothetical protein
VESGGEGLSSGSKGREEIRERISDVYHA